MKKANLKILFPVLSYFPKKWTYRILPGSHRYYDMQIYGKNGNNFFFFQQLRLLSEALQNHTTWKKISFLRQIYSILKGVETSNITSNW